MVAARHGSLPFREQIAFFRSKVTVPTRAWADVYASENDHAFAVAGASRMAIVEDFADAVGRAIEDGRTLEDFRRDFDDIVARHGWAYNGSRGWRSRVIYDTNLRQSYAAGREAQMADPELRRARPYGLYRHGGSEHPRPHHLAKDGWVVPIDNPWWDTWTPQNGWGCSCKKFMLSQADVDRLGLAVKEPPPIEYEERVVGANGPNTRTVQVPVGIDPGFEHRPGASRIRAVTPPPLDAPLIGLPGRLFPARRATDELPPTRPFQGQLLAPGGTNEDYVQAFLTPFGATLDEPALFRDVLGEPLLISSALFQNHRGDWKVRKAGRERYLPVLADALRTPDEIWIAAEYHRAAGKPVLRRRYIAEFQIEGSDLPMIGVFEWGRDGWMGVTTFQAEAGRASEIADMRQGVRLYRRGEDE